MQEKVNPERHIFPVLKGGLGAVKWVNKTLWVGNENLEGDHLLSGMETISSDEKVRKTCSPS